MSNCVLPSAGIVYFTSFWNRICSLLLTVFVVGLLCTSAVCQSNDTFATSQASTPATDQSNETQAATRQPGMSATDNQSDDTQQSDSTASQAANQSANQTASGTENQVESQTTSQSPMSAEQIIAILQQQPDLLASFKAAAAQQLGVDPSTITDDALYNRIQQDADARVQATKELNRLGYSTNPPTESKTTKTEKGVASTTQTRKLQTGRPAPKEPQDEPKSIQRPNPYGNLVSVHDLYTQIPSAGGHLRRFGSNAFVVGTGNANELPMDIPVGPDYVLGPGDTIVVNMWGSRSEKLNVTIDRQGQIALPQAGTITLNGLTIGAAQDAIQKALDTQFRDEHVEISLGRLRTVRVYVVGDVQRPGAYDVSSLSTPLSALYAAGGPTSHGSLRVLRQYRGKQLLREIDLYDLLLRGVRSDIDHLLPGDTILVPPVGPQVTVEGMVHRPAIYELNGDQGLNEVLDLAGGVLVTASLKQINVERVDAHQQRTMVSVDLPDSPDGMRQKLAGFRVQDGDDVVVSQILPYNQQAVYLEGHVYRPGKYPYREGMTIADLLHSYQDVMPEPSDHVELVRLQSPDYRPETLSLHLSDILVGNNNMLLQPFDLIRVYGRYEIDSPKVSIEGEVLRPGEYPMSQGMTVAGLVNMAGGFRRSAYRDEAELSSYVIQNGQGVLVNHETVNLKKALDGDKSADVALKTGDVVSIRQLAGWQDIGSSVTVEGEVEHAGSYGIDQGERLSSVLKRAGGFRESAYPAAAILERVQVRELGEQARQEMIRRLETTPLDIKSGVLTVQDQAGLQQSLQQQQQQVLTALRNHPASGRQVISISSDISSWENTSADIEMRAGDRLIIPKRPTFVVVSGQVYNATAITYVPGKDVSWYLNKAGGATPSGNKKDVYVLRADGSIVVHGTSWINGNFMNMRLRPGDSVIVPEKLIGGSQVWRNIIATAQIMSSVAFTGAVAGIY